MKAKVQKNKKRFKILTYNILHFPRSTPFDKDYFRKPRLRRIAHEVRDFDVLCLQEMYRLLSENLDLFLEELQKNGFKYFNTVPLNPPLEGFLGDGGIMIVSKNPIIYSEYFHWDKAIFQDGNVQKGGLYCQIELSPGNILHVVDIHIQAIYFFHSLEQNVDCMFMRHRQLMQLKEWIFGLFEKFGIVDGDMFLLCGDFNCEAEKDDLISRTFFQELAKSPMVKSLKPESIKQLVSSKNMFDYLNNFMNVENPYFNVLDLVFEDFKRHPISFGEILYDEEGNKVPGDAILTDFVEFFAEQRLDYIFQLRPKHKKLELSKSSKSKIQPNQTGEFAGFYKDLSRFIYLFFTFCIYIGC